MFGSYNSANAMTGRALTSALLPINTNPRAPSAIAAAADRIIANQAIVTRVTYYKNSQFNIDIVGKFPAAGPLLLSRAYHSNEKKDRYDNVIIHVSQLNTLFKKQIPKINKLLAQPEIQAFKNLSIASLAYSPDLSKSDYISHDNPKAYGNNFNAVAHRKANIFERFPDLYDQEMLMTPDQAVEKWKLFGAIHTVHTESSTPEISVLVGKRCTVTNYWGPVSALKIGCFVGFIVRYKNTIKDNGEFENAKSLEMVAWHGFSLPDRNQTERKDFNGFFSQGVIIVVGTVVDYTTHYMSDTPGLLNAKEEEVNGLLTSNQSFLVLNMHVRYQQ